MAFRHLDCANKCLNKTVKTRTNYPQQWSSRAKFNKCEQEMVCCLNIAMASLNGMLNIPINEQRLLYAARHKANQTCLNMLRLAIEFKIFGWF